jgi:hypothetical protein
MLIYMASSRLYFLAYVLVYDHKYTSGQINTDKDKTIVSRCNFKSQNLIPAIFGQEELQFSQKK